jgi:oxygen-independent coproporphyrinogen-3 oxidase
MLQFTSLPPLTLYIHIPWCIKKCPYCDFNSHQLAPNEIPEEDYVNALIRDLEYDLPAVWGRTVDTIFIGGGTPSLLSADAIENLLSAIRARLPLKPQLEITLEANPGAINSEKLQAFRAAGINRLSLGVQSFSNKLLQRLGRVHNGEDALNTIENIKEVGFENWNIDLMYGLPGQTLADALNDIHTAIAYSPPHISHYQLTIEPNTLFHARPPALPEDDDIWTIYQQCHNSLAKHQYGHYETSAYAKDDPQGHHQCHHNLNYWHFGDYLGIGAGAHAKISNAQYGYIERSWKTRHPLQYMKDTHALRSTNTLLNSSSAAHISGNKKLLPADILLEFMMNTLRLTAGFPVTLFQDHTGLPVAVAEPALQQAETKGLIKRDYQTIRPSDLGQRFLNDLLALYMTDNSTPRHIVIAAQP